eukprot:3813739-Rhodomonas_salina.1
MTCSETAAEIAPQLSHRSSHYPTPSHTIPHHSHTILTPFSHHSHTSPHRSHAFSHFPTPSHTFSHHLTPSHTFSHHLTPSVSRRLTPCAREQEEHKTLSSSTHSTLDSLQQQVASSSFRSRVAFVFPAFALGRRDAEGARRGAEDPRGRTGPQQEGTNLPTFSRLDSPSAAILPVSPSQIAHIRCPEATALPSLHPLSLFFKAQTSPLYCRHHTPHLALCRCPLAITSPTLTR